MYIDFSDFIQQLILNCLNIKLVSLQINIKYNQYNNNTFLVHTRKKYNLSAYLQPCKPFPLFSAMNPSIFFELITLI